MKPTNDTVQAQKGLQSTFSRRNRSLERDKLISTHTCFGERCVPNICRPSEVKFHLLSTLYNQWSAEGVCVCVCTMTPGIQSKGATNPAIRIGPRASGADQIAPVRKDESAPVFLHIVLRKRAALSTGKGWSKFRIPKWWHFHSGKTLVLPNWILQCLQQAHYSEQECERGAPAGRGSSWSRHSGCIPSPQKTLCSLRLPLLFALLVGHATLLPALP